MIGQTLSHYKILRQLGEGGMGVVYEAEDTKLKRHVALKVLPSELAGDPERLERFQREAEALATLNHPNIVTVYAVEEADGVHFLTMELVRGQSLDQAIPARGMDLDTFFATALPLTEALSTAHELGITHRDLKPRNIMLDENGHPKVLDFGLAKLHEIETEDEMTRALGKELTGEGMIVGTVPYMSPEQLEGKSVDPRTDIFSLGIIMYEMATGERPFQGDSSAAVMSAILKDTPPSVTQVRAQLPRHLGRVIGSCLEKNPENRPQTAKGLRNTLRTLQKELETESILDSGSRPLPRPATRSLHPTWVLGGIGAVAVVLALIIWQGRTNQTAESQAPDIAAESTAPDRLMIAVLPFENLGAPEDEYFADGLTEEITSRLVMVKDLGVISRTSAMQYKSNRPSLRQIGQELGVDYVLEGTVRWERRPDGISRIRVTPQLISVADDTHLWASRYDKQLDEIFAVQSDIAETVAKQLNITLLAPEKQAIETRPTENMEAYQAYLRGMDAWNQPGYDPDRFRLAIQLFERAVTLDPEFLLAWTELTSVYDMLYMGGDAGEEILQKAAQALARAEAIQPDHPMVQLAKGYHYYLGYLDYERALAEFEAVAALLPNNPQIHEGIGYIRRRQGRFRDSIARLEEALRLDPQNAHLHLGLASTYQAVREHVAADHHFDRSIALAPDGIDAYIEKAENLISWRGAVAEARAVLEKAPQQRHPYIVGGLTGLDMLKRDFPGAGEQLSILTPETMESPVSQVRYYIGLGQIRLHLGQVELAREAFMAGQSLASSLVEAAPSHHGYHYGLLAMLEAYLGEEEAARQAAARGSELAADDLFFGPTIKEDEAAILMHFGHHDAAVERLEEMITTPYFSPLTRYDLRLNPLWDPLRNNPRFQQLLASDDSPES